MEEFVGGWFWLQEDLWDEIWKQTSEHRYDAAQLELQFGPVQSAGATSRWNVEMNASLPIVQAGLNFDRKLKRAPNPDAPVEPPRKRGFSWIWG